MSTYIFDVTVSNVNQYSLVKLPLEISKMLPSRGMNMAEIQIENYKATLPLEPDGKGSHFFMLDENVFEPHPFDLSHPYTITLSLVEDWPEPSLPSDLYAALKLFQVEALWAKLTTKAMWEWIRWIRSTNNSATREKRIKITCDKLSLGKKRPCCFDHSRCTEQEVSKSGILL